MDQERLLLRVSEAADRLGISRSKAYQLLKTGELPGAMQVGHSVRINARVLDRWVEERSTAPNTSA